jgi:hypothetical protein
MIWRMWWWIWFTGKGGMITRESLSLFKACKGSRNFSQGINFPKSKGNYYTKGVGKNLKPHSTPKVWNSSLFSFFLCLSLLLFVIISQYDFFYYIF